MRRSRVMLAVAVCLTFFMISHAAAQSPDRDALARLQTARIDDMVGALSNCPKTPITPPVTLTGRISAGSCKDLIGLRGEYYALTVTAGQTADITVTSRDFDLFVFMYIASGTSVDFDHDGSILTGQPSKATARHRFAAGGTYELEIASLWSSDPLPTSLPWSGSYTVTVTLTGGNVPPVTSTQVVPIVGRLSGSGGSEFRSDLKLYNPTSSTVTGRLVFTPRGQSAASTDTSLAFSVPPNGVRFYEDVYGVAFPSGAGAARLAVVTDGTAKLTVDTSTYTAVGNGGELGQSPTVLTGSSYASAGARLVAVLGKASERTNVFVSTGASSTQIRWQYRDANGGSGAVVTRDYARDATHQQSAADLLGFAPAPNSTLEATIVSGSASLATSPVNNTTNQGRWTDFKIVQ